MWLAWLARALCGSGADADAREGCRDGEFAGPPSEPCRSLLCLLRATELSAAGRTRRAQARRMTTLHNRLRSHVPWDIASPAGGRHNQPGPVTRRSPRMDIDAVSLPAGGCPEDGNCTTCWRLSAPRRRSGIASAMRQESQKVSRVRRPATHTLLDRISALSYGRN